MVEAWNDLLARAEHERALAAEGRWEELAVAGAERVRLATALPAPPPEARGVLERIALVQDDLTATLLAAREGVTRELATLRRGRGAMRGYSPAVASRGNWVDETH